MTLCAVSTESLFPDHPVIRNDAWLVARGVRPMSLTDKDIELLTGDDAEAIQHNGSIMQQAVQELRDISASVTGASAELEPIPFAIPTMSDDPEDDGPAQWLTCGFAAYPVDRRHGDVAVVGRAHVLPVRGNPRAPAWLLTRSHTGLPRSASRRRPRSRDMNEPAQTPDALRAKQATPFCLVAAPVERNRAPSTTTGRADRASARSLDVRRRNA